MESTAAFSGTPREFLDEFLRQLRQESGPFADLPVSTLLDLKSKVLEAHRADPHRELLPNRLLFDVNRAILKLGRSHGRPEDVPALNDLELALDLAAPMETLDALSSARAKLPSTDVWVYTPELRTALTTAVKAMCKRETTAGKAKLEKANVIWGTRLEKRGDVLVLDGMDVLFRLFFECLASCTTSPCCMLCLRCRPVADSHFIPRAIWAEVGEQFYDIQEDKTKAPAAIYAPLICYEDAKKGLYSGCEQYLSTVEEPFKDTWIAGPALGQPAFLELLREAWTHEITPSQATLARPAAGEHTVNSTDFRCLVSIAYRLILADAKLRSDAVAFRPDWQPLMPTLLQSMSRMRDYLLHRTPAPSTFSVHVLAVRDEVLRTSSALTRIHHFFGVREAGSDLLVYMHFAVLGVHFLFIDAASSSMVELLLEGSMVFGGTAFAAPILPDAASVITLPSAAAATLPSELQQLYEEHLEEKKRHLAEMSSSRINPAHLRTMEQLLEPLAISLPKGHVLNRLPGPIMAVTCHDGQHCQLEFRKSGYSIKSTFTDEAGNCSWLCKHQFSAPLWLVLAVRQADGGFIALGYQFSMPANVVDVTAGYGKQLEADAEAAPPVELRAANATDHSGIHIAQSVINRLLHGCLVAYCGLLE